MSSTIKQAILSLKSRIADAYTAIVAKGGTPPATQDSANLPTAIASIPSGGKVYVGNYSNFRAFWFFFTGTDAGEQNIDFTNRTSAVSLHSLMQGASNIEKVDLSNWSCVVNDIEYAFSGLTSCKSIKFGTNIDTSFADWSGTFYEFGRYAQDAEIDLRGVSVTNTNNDTFAYTNGVTSFRVGSSFLTSALLTSLRLTREAAVVFFNDLATLPAGTNYTLRLYGITYDTLSDDDKAIATSKGWILQRG